MSLGRANEIRVANAATCHTIGGLPPDQAQAEIERILTEPVGHEPYIRLDKLLAAPQGKGHRSAGTAVFNAGLAHRFRPRVKDITVRQRLVLRAVVAGQQVQHEHGFRVTKGCFV